MQSPWRSYKGDGTSGAAVAYLTAHSIEKCVFIMSANTTSAHNRATTPQLYCTRNINLAASILALKKLKLASVEKSESGHAEIYFDDPEHMGPRIEHDYVTRSLKVEVRTMVDHRALLLGEIKRLEANDAAR